MAQKTNNRLSPELMAASPGSLGRRQHHKNLTGTFPRRPNRSVTLLTHSTPRGAPPEYRRFLGTGKLLLMEQSRFFCFTISRKIKYLFPALVLVTLSCRFEHSLRKAKQWVSSREDQSIFLVQESIYWLASKRKQHCQNNCKLTFYDVQRASLSNKIKTMTLQILKKKLKSHSIFTGCTVVRQCQKWPMLLISE